MKSVTQIARECGLKWQQVQEVVKKEGIIPAKKKGRYRYFDEYQEEYIHSILYFSLMTTEITIESKMNK